MVVWFNAECIGTLSTFPLYPQFPSNNGRNCKFYWSVNNSVLGFGFVERRNCHFKKSYSFNKSFSQNRPQFSWLSDFKRARIIDTAPKGDQPWERKLTNPLRSNMHIRPDSAPAWPPTVAGRFWRAAALKAASGSQPNPFWLTHEKRIPG